MFSSGWWSVSGAHHRGQPVTIIIQHCKAGAIKLPSLPTHATKTVPIGCPNLLTDWVVHPSANKSWQWPGSQTDVAWRKDWYMFLPQVLTAVPQQPCCPIVTLLEQMKITPLGSAESVWFERSMISGHMFLAQESGGQVICLAGLLWFCEDWALKHVPCSPMNLNPSVFWDSLPWASLRGSS